MIKKFSLYLSILISFVSFQIPIISSTKIIDKDIEEILGPEYLKNLPSEDYIVGPGDKLKIVGSREYEELTTIETVDGEMTISIFPNPTSNTINVVFDKELELSLFNILGQQVIKTSNKNIDISNFEKGTYILVVENIETGNFTNFKIIKE